ncbi:metal ABC transporter substrate-binding protein [Clostridium carboxidivorans P7]|uniref:NLPA lipoprotein n=1 Tax=Clostridium carboxidivorans P7 TaxID=536227 RepID=C6PZT1_9CLOT|nr:MULTISPECIES: MetQ/NlpA family ABC transporter substrate-binding protein [Clostridium]AKN31758.1 metal ABC transporter substrate-binding protein [Clostridium carboxidivorans P7]EET85238.1 NLPA lipoprotein [Clostridium carboxidivorans P7]EFG87415.1 NLPA lipoprotein [Clostridium carboxidivorans P7]WPC43577.1 MetQ/NlpA family ABC transporter substrate-binding protein [Clostridium sp. JS66]
MKKFMKLMLCMLVITTSMTACGKSNATSSSSDEKKSIKIGMRADSLDYGNEAAKALKQKGYDVKVVTFNDSIGPDTALGEGSIDANIYQHEPYLQNYNKSNKTNFVMVKPKLWAPVFGMYSSKYKDYKELPDGATIGLCNDATNQSRGLNLLNEIGLIKLPADKKSPSIYDVKDNAAVNPKKFKFIEADMQTLPQSLKDVDCILLAATHMVNAGLDASKYIASPKDNETYAVGVVVKNGNENKKWVKDLNDAYRTEGIKELLKKKAKGTLIPLF